jgi:hypothetical protein
MNALILASMSGSDNAILHTIIWIVVLGIIFWVLAYFKLPEPFLKIAQIILVVAAVVILIRFLLSL